MFKKLLDLWREDQDPLKEMVEQFEEMLLKGQQMYRSVTDALFLGGDMGRLREETYQNDGQLNDLEQKIRRQVVVHLSLGHVSDLTPSLILMSVVKDAERLGDYAKNIFQVAEVVSPLKSGKYLKELQETRNDIVGYFDEVRIAFVESDLERGRQVLRGCFTHEKNIDAWVTKLLQEQNQENSVAFAVLFRFFKRTISHLGNIATSTVMPVDKLDYFDEDHRNEMGKI